MCIIIKEKKKRRRERRTTTTSFALWFYEKDDVTGLYSMHGFCVEKERYLHTAYYIKQKRRFNLIGSVNRRWGCHQPTNCRLIHKRAREIVQGNSQLQNNVLYNKSRDIFSFLKQRKEHYFQQQYQNQRKNHHQNTSQKMKAKNVEWVRERKLEGKKLRRKLKEEITQTHTQDYYTQIYICFVCHSNGRHTRGRKT